MFLHINSFSVFLILAWLVYSFLFWKSLRAQGVDEDKIFDLTFYATLAALVVSRLGFVVFHWELFSDTWLKIVALWVQPGLSLYGALFGGLLTLVSMCRSQKVRLGLVLDAFAISFAPAMGIGLVGAFLEGSIPYPTVLYEIVLVFAVAACIYVLVRRSALLKYPVGVIGVWFFLLYSAGMFLVEFTSKNRVYWLHLSANQWVLMVIFAESLGAFYVRGGGREFIRPIVNKLYAKFSKRHS